ncbi:hypothetical protein [Streptomyces luteireticuli]|uniref:Uncharacterized protein n=1 Tax=Streptomyces luteireticuli TaxID=173858 RepID=A0ABN0YUM1_9ACTN
MTDLRTAYQFPRPLTGVTRWPERRGGDVVPVRDQNAAQLPTETEQREQTDQPGENAP